MGVLNLTLTNRGESRLLEAALGRINQQQNVPGTVSNINTWGSLKLRLFENDVTTGKSTVAGDLTEATVSGYSEIDITPMHFVRRTDSTDTTNTVYSREYQFDFTGSGNIYGAYIVEPDAVAASQNVDTIVAEADDAGSLSGTAFLFWNVPEDFASYPDDGYYVWFDTGSSVDPAIVFDGVSLTGIQVSITENDTAATIGGLVRTAISNSSAGVTVSGSDANIILTSDEAGKVDEVAQDDSTGWSSFTNTPGNYRLFSGVAEATKIQCVSGSTLGGTYFGIISPENGGMDVPIYVWYNTGSSSDPSPGGFAAGVEVSINSTDTAAEVAAKTHTAISNSFFKVYGVVPTAADGDFLYIENRYGGDVTAIDAETTGFTVTQLLDSSDTGIIWFAGNFSEPLAVVDGDDVKITLQLTLN